MRTPKQIAEEAARTIVAVERGHVRSGLYNFGTALVVTVGGVEVFHYEAANAAVMERVERDAGEAAAQLRKAFVVFLERMIEEALWQCPLPQGCSEVIPLVKHWKELRAVYDEYAQSIGFPIGWVAESEVPNFPPGHKLGDQFYVPKTDSDVNSYYVAVDDVCNALDALLTHTDHLHRVFSDGPEAADYAKGYDDGKKAGRAEQVWTLYWNDGFADADERLLGTYLSEADLEDAEVRYKMLCDRVRPVDRPEPFRSFPAGYFVRRSCKVGDCIHADG